MQILIGYQPEVVPDATQPMSLASLILCCGLVLVRCPSRQHQLTRMGPNQNEPPNLPSITSTSEPQSKHDETLSLPF